MISGASSSESSSDASGGTVRVSVGGVPRTGGGQGGEGVIREIERRGGEVSIGSIPECEAGGEADLEPAIESGNT